MSARSNISCSFRALYFWSCAQVTAGSYVLGSFSAFCYKFCEQVTTGANVWRFFIIDFVQRLLRKQLLLLSFSVFYRWLIFCAQMTTRAVMISGVTASGSGMRGVLTFALFFHLLRAFFLDHFTSFNWNFVFSLVLIRFSCCVPFCSELMCRMVGISLAQTTLWLDLQSLCS